MILLYNSVIGVFMITKQFSCFPKILLPYFLYSFFYTFYLIRFNHLLATYRYPFPMCFLNQVLFKEALINLVCTFNHLFEVIVGCFLINHIELVITTSILNI